MGRRHQHAQHQTERIDQQMALAPFDFLGRVVADAASMPVGLDALAVQDAGGGAAPLALLLAGQASQAGVETLPRPIQRPLAEDRVDRLPRRKARGKQTPRNASLDHIKDGIDHPASIRWRTAQLGGRWAQRLQEGPLGDGEVGFVKGAFSSPNRAALINGTPSPTCKIKVFPRFGSTIFTPHQSHLTPLDFPDFSDTL